MRVRCVSNRTDDPSIPCSNAVDDGWLTDLSAFLTRGKEYTVYALASCRGVPAYVLCSDRYWRYPELYPAGLFEVSDPRPSRYWEVGFWPGSADRQIRPAFFIGPPAWIAEASFYERVLDGQEAELAEWRRFKQSLDQEAGLAGGV
jgi:hypothetical protein